MSKKVGKPYMLNCWFPIIRLLLKGKLYGIIWAYPYHLMGITRFGNYVHFSSTKKKEVCVPFYFEGQIKVTKGYEISRRHLILWKKYGLKLNRPDKSVGIRNRNPEYFEGTNTAWA